jgi:uncharacterized protein
MFCGTYKQQKGKALQTMIMLTLLSVGLLGCTSLLPLAQNKIAEQPVSMAKATPGQVLPIEGSALIGTHRFKIEVARTPQQQAIGLMYRKFLPDNRGMVFPFTPPRQVSFWMKNVVMSLDMVFVREGKVVAIASEVPPCKADPCPVYGPPSAIDHVIELRGGRAKSLGLKPGDPVAFQWNKQR